MQKKMVIILMFILLLNLAGCGKQEDSAELQVNGNTSYKVEVDPIINREDKSEIEEAAEEPVKYNCMDEIKNASPDSGLVQIDDMIFQYGVEFSEIASEIEQSECTYDAEYNVSSVVPAGESLGIRFYKDDKKYFMICVENPKAETVELKDCIIYSIRVLEGSMRNAYYAGFNGDEATYSTIKEIMKDNEPVEEIFGSDSQGNNELGIMYTLPFQEDQMYVYFIFDSLTNELKKFEIASKKYDRVAWLW